jgi:hypothetical protein
MKFYLSNYDLIKSAKKKPDVVLACFLANKQLDLSNCFAHDSCHQALA